MTRAFVLLGMGVFVLGASLVMGAAPPATPESLRKLASEYYRWRDQSYPVASSSQGLHTWDDRLADFSAGAIAARKKRVADLLGQVRAMPADGWGRDDRIDWLLFRAQLETVEFFDRVMDNDPVEARLRQISDGPTVFTGKDRPTFFF